MTRTTYHAASGGSRDAELTNHGYHQAVRLGRFLVENKVILTHIYASPLRRASKTAELILASQSERREAESGAEAGTSDSVSPRIEHDRRLVERDFGSMEGKLWSWKARNAARQNMGPGDGEDDEGPFLEMEPEEALAARLNSFINDGLMGLLQSALSEPSSTVAVVSHGIALHALFRLLSHRLASGMDSLRSKGLDRPIKWSNTGYLELELKHVCMAPKSSVLQPGVVIAGGASIVIKRLEGSVEPPDSGANGSTGPESAIANIAPAVPDVSFGGSAIRPPCSEGSLPCSVAIRVIDGRGHLVGFKRTRGGVGSSQHDAKQKTMDGFVLKKKI